MCQMTTHRESNSIQSTAMLGLNRGQSCDVVTLNRRVRGEVVEKLEGGGKTKEEELEESKNGIDKQFDT